MVYLSFKKFFHLLFEKVQIVQLCSLKPSSNRAFQTPLLKLLNIHLNTPLNLIDNIYIYIYACLCMYMCMSDIYMCIYFGLNVLNKRYK